MPWGGLGRPGLFDQNMVMKHLGGPGLHQISSNLSRRRPVNNIRKLRDAGPIAVIVKETTTLTVPQVLGSIRARISHIAGNTSAQILHMISKKTFHQNHAIAGICVNMVLGE